MYIPEGPETPMQRRFWLVLSWVIFGSIFGSLAFGILGGADAFEIVAPVFIFGMAACGWLCVFFELWGFIKTKQIDWLSLALGLAFGIGFSYMLVRDLGMID